MKDNICGGTARYKITIQRDGEAAAEFSSGVTKNTYRFQDF